jgi:hypothetical protein
MLKRPDSLADKTVTNIAIIIDASAVTDECKSKAALDLASEIHADTMTAYLQWKFPDRAHSKNKDWLSLLLSDLEKAGIRSYEQVEKIINDNLKWFNSFEKANPPSNSSNHRFSDIGVMRIILSKRLRLKP